MKKHIFIFRHGQTDWNKENRIQGQRDIPLNDEGKKQAAILVALLKEHNLDHIVCSDLLRTRETVDPLLAEQKISISYHQELREISAGVYEGRTHEELAHEHIWNVVKNNPDKIFHDLQLPGGESRAQVQLRMVNFIQEFIDNSPHTKIGISTHGFSMKLFLTGIETNYSFTLEHAFPNAHIVQLMYDADNKKWEIIDGHQNIPAIDKGL